MNNDNPTCVNLSHPTELSATKQNHLRAQYKKLLNLIPHGKHKKNQRRKGGGFGNSKLERSSRK